MNIAIITGASSGLGKEFARQLDKRLGHTDEIWLLARSRAALDELAESLRHKTRVIVIDLTEEKELRQFEEVLTIRSPRITVLVNCAGVGSHKPFFEQSRTEIEAMVQVNVVALTRMTAICLPYLKQGSRLLQIASGAAFVPQKNFAVYAASKAYVYSFSRALGAELKERGVRVTTVCPGPVDTPFLDRAYGDVSELNLLRKLTMAEPARVAAKAITDCRRGKQVSVCGLPMGLLYLGTQGIANISLL